jgi:hypothetical protein
MDRVLTDKPVKCSLKRFAHTLAEALRDFNLAAIPATERHVANQELYRFGQRGVPC